MARHWRQRLVPRRGWAPKARQEHTARDSSAWPGWPSAEFRLFGDRNRSQRKHAAASPRAADSVATPCPSGINRLSRVARIVPRTRLPIAARQNQVCTTRPRCYLPDRPHFRHWCSGGARHQAPIRRPKPLRRPDRGKPGRCGIDFDTAGSDLQAATSHVDAYGIDTTIGTRLREPEHRVRLAMRCTGNSRGARQAAWNRPGTHTSIASASLIVSSIRSRPISQNAGSRRSSPKGASNSG